MGETMMDALQQQDVTTIADHANQYLTFLLGDEEYGVEILRVQEVKGWEPVRNMPNLPSYVKGVINLRGDVVPIICLRERLGMELKNNESMDVIIVLRINTDKGQTIMGVVVDGVSEVYNIDEEMMQTPPDFGQGIDTSFVNSVATINDKMIVLLDVDKLLYQPLLDEVSRVNED